MTAPQRKALTNPQRELLDIFLRLTREKEPVSHEEFNRFSKELRSGGFDYSHLIGESKNERSAEISRDWCDCLDKSISLVEDMIGDGVEFTSAELAEITRMFFESEDKMVPRFLLIKKIARRYSVAN